MSINRIKTESREEWKALRKKYIGGSDAAAVIGLNPYNSPFSVWAEKTGQAPEFEGNLATEVGTYLEEFVAQKFEDETGKTVRRCNLSLVNDDYPWAIANVDRMVVGEDAGLEIKTTSELNMKSFKNGEYPATYYTQCVHYLAVSSKARWYLAVLIGNREFKIFTIERDQAEIDALMQAEKSFWNDYVVRGATPPVDGHSATTEAIRKIFPQEMLPEADLSDCYDLFASRKALVESKKQITAQIDAIENDLKVRMGLAATGKCGAFSVSWKTQRSSALDREAIKADYPDIDFSKYSKESRVFRINEKKGAK